MGRKKTKQFFDIVEEVNFKTFMESYWEDLNLLYIRVSGINLMLRDKKKVPKSYLADTRSISINVDKFNKVFRKRTLKMEKK